MSDELVYTCKLVGDLFLYIISRYATSWSKTICSTMHVLIWDQHVVSGIMIIGIGGGDSASRDERVHL